MNCLNQPSAFLLSAHDRVDCEYELCKTVSCRALGIEPGVAAETFVPNGQLTLVKKVAGSAKGLLSDVHSQASMTDKESMQSVIT